MSSAHRIRAWRAAVPRLSRFALEHLLLLPLGAAIALVWANSDAESYYRFTYAIAFAVNDVAMVFFFALMTKEVVEATAPGGVLHPWRRGLLPVIASIGATTVPAVIYLQVVDALDEPVLALGWPTTFATDIAVAYFIARITFGLHPAVPFLLLLAIASDVLGFVVLALLYPGAELHFVGGAFLMATAIGLAFVLRRRRVRSIWPYLLTAGAGSWCALYWSGLHPALALVPIVPFLPHAARDPGFFVDASPTARDPLSQLEIWFRYPAQVALFFFGLVNAGIPLRALEAGTWGLPLAVIAGKPVGILIAVGAAVTAGLHLPRQVGWRDLIVGGFITAIGFSIGMFICSALIPPGQARSEISMGVLLTLGGGLLALLSAKVLRVGRFAR